MRSLPSDQLLCCGVTEVGEDARIEEFGDQEGQLRKMEWLDVVGGHEDGGVYRFCVWSRNTRCGVRRGCGGDCHNRSILLGLLYISEDRQLGQCCGKLLGLIL